MSGLESSEEGTFVECDQNATPMAYDKGGVPFYVVIAWVVFLVAYVIYMVVYGLPDFSAWGEL